MKEKMTCSHHISGPLRHEDVVLYRLPLPNITDQKTKEYCLIYVEFLEKHRVNIINMNFEYLNRFWSDADPITYYFGLREENDNIKNFLEAVRDVDWQNYIERLTKNLLKSHNASTVHSQNSVATTHTNNIENCETNISSFNGSSLKPNTLDMKRNSSTCDKYIDKFIANFNKYYNCLSKKEFANKVGMDEDAVDDLLSKLHSEKRIFVKEKEREEDAFGFAYLFDDELFKF